MCIWDFRVKPIQSLWRLQPWEWAAQYSDLVSKTTMCSVFQAKKILQAVFWFTFMAGEGLVVCLEIFSTVYSSCVAFWNASPPPPAVYIRPFQRIIAPARSSDRTTWLMLNSSRSKMCLLINTGPRAPLFTVVMVAVSYLENIGSGFLVWESA